MIRLEIRKDGRVVRTLRLGDGVHGIGRHESNEIRLDDVEVSRRHARLLIDGHTVVVEDLGSNNGTLLDGSEVARAVMPSGARVEVTPFTMSWVDPVKDAASFVVVEGAQVGRRIPLLDDALSIGRGDDQDIVLDDKGASRSHAILVFNDGVWAARDTGSANGLFLNGDPTRDTTLFVGDLLQVGNTVLRFEDPKGRRRPAPSVPEPVAFAEEPETEIHTQGSQAETALVMPGSEEDAPTDVMVSPLVPPSAQEVPMAAPADPGNVGLIALVVTVMGIVLFLVMVLALVGTPG